MHRPHLCNMSYTIQMKIKHLIVAAVALLIGTNAMAQTKKSFTLEDLMWGGNNYANIMPKYYGTAFWGDRLLKLDVDEVSTLVSDKGKAEKPRVLFTTDQLNAAIDTAKYGKVYNLLYAQFPSGSKSEVYLQTSKLNLLYNWQQRKVVWSTERTPGAYANDMSHYSHNEAFVKDWNLYVKTADGKTHQVSTDGSRELQYGLSVHRDEFGIRKGTFWSPKGHLLAFYRMDQSMVTDYPLVDINHRAAQLAPEKYPMAGMTSHKVTVGVYNPATDKTVYLQAGDPTDRYFTNIAWSPDESTIYMFELPRTQDKAELVAYDAHTGARKGVLYTESNARYVEPCNPIQFLPWDATKFVMQTRRDGYNHLYLFTADGRQLKQLTKGQFEVISVLGFNTKAKSIIYQSNQDNPIQYSNYSVNVATGKVARLDNGQGTHYAALSENGLYLSDRWSSPTTFRQYDLLGTTQPAAAVKLHADADPWTAYNVPEISGGKIKAADGKTDLYYRLVKPVGFDPAKSTPQ